MNNSADQIELHRYIVSIMLLVFVSACSDDGQEDIVSGAPFEFHDGFEGATELNDLFVSDGSRWTTLQQVDPDGATNEIGINNDLSSEGNNSLHFLARKSDVVLSKIDIEKSGFQAFSNSTVIISADFYISTLDPISDILLIDLECCSCWDTSVPDNQCPGVRLQMSAENDYLYIERGKISQETIRQSSVKTPRNKWFNVTWAMNLSEENENSLNQLTIDGIEAISAKGMNLPNAEIFRQIFATNNIDFKLQEPVFYERIQIGVTANPTAGEIELLVDNFSMVIK